MVCSCENRCSCEEHCACCGKYGGAVCRGKKIYNNSLFPICKANLLDNSNEINLTSSTVTLSTEKGNRALNKMKFKKYKASKESAVPLSTTSYKPSTNDNKSLIPENEQTKLSVQKAPNMSRFNSLKQSMMKMKRRFKKLKIRKNDNRTLLALPERDHESTEESSVGTTSSKEADFSTSKRTKSLSNKSYSTENILQHLCKSEKVSFPLSQNNHNIKLISRAKSLTLTFNAEDGASDKLGCNLTRTADNLISRMQSRLYTKEPSHYLQSCSSPHLFNSNPECASNSKKEKYALAEDKQCKMINLKNSENFLDKQFTISYKPAILKRNILKCRSTSDDKSITEPLYSGFQDELCFCAQPLTFRIDEKKNSEFINSEINSQATNTEIVNKPLNESPKALNSPPRSTSHNKVETSQSVSPISVHCSESLNRPVFELSLNETIELNNSDITDHDITDVTTVNFASSDGSDNFEIRSSPDSTDSESISSSEFSPCSYCRYVICIPPISDSVIPYEALE